jgi:glycyl-tRNA synthetase
LLDSDLATRVDKSSAALGRRYARSDEIGVPFAVTVDFDTLKDDTVTIRERDSMVQVRLPKSEVTPVIFAIVHKKMNWEQLTQKYPVVQVDDGEGNAPAAPAAENSVAKTVVVSNSRGRFSRPTPKN